MPRKRKERKQKKKKKRKHYLKGKVFAPGLSYLGGLAGDALSSSLGLPGGKAIGGMLGRKAGAWLSKITGFGDYKVSRNTLMSANAPVFGRSTLRVTHREFVSDIKIIGEAFNLTTWVVQPENPTLFPWLSTIVGNYSEYKFKGLIFHYKSTSATAIGSTNTGLGTVVCATQYDVLEDPFTSKSQMEAHEFCVSAAPDESVIHPVECDPAESPLDVLYVQNSSVVNTSDARFHDFAKFSLATVGQQPTATGEASTIGELWVSYDIELLKPKKNVTATKISYHNDCLPETGFWNKGVNVHSGSSSLISFPDNTLESRIYKSGRYLLQFTASGSFTGGTITHLSPEVGVTIVKYFGNHTKSQDFCLTGNQYSYAIVIDCVVDNEYGYAAFIPPHFTIASTTTADTIVIELGTNLSARSPTSESEKQFLYRLGIKTERKLYSVVRQPLTHTQRLSQQLLEQKSVCDSRLRDYLEKSGSPSEEKERKETKVSTPSSISGQYIDLTKLRNR